MVRTVLASCALALSLASAPAVRAGTLTADLVCVLNTLGTGPCAPGASFGMVTLTDEGVDPGTVKITVDLLNAGLKFKDLMLNFADPDGLVTSISSTDAEALLSANAFSIPPYGGLFDVGSTTQQGWNGNSGYMTILSGNFGLNLLDFDILDSLGNLNVQLHVQTIGSSTGGDCDGSGQKAPCVPGKIGTGSLKIGGVWASSEGDLPPTEAPEPGTFLLLGAGLLTAGYLARRARSTR